MYVHIYFIFYIEYKCNSRSHYVYESMYPTGMKEIRPDIMCALQKRNPLSLVVGCTSFDTEIK